MKTTKKNLNSYLTKMTKKRAKAPTSTKEPQTTNVNQKHQLVKKTTTTLMKKRCSTSLRNALSVLLKN